MVLDLFERFVQTVTESNRIARARETFLNVDQTEYYRLFLLFMFVKCAIAGYGMKKIVPDHVSFLIFYASFWHSCFCDYSPEGLVFHVAFYALAGMLLVLSYDQLPTIFSGAAWAIPCMSLPFHHTLDLYIIVTISGCIIRKQHLEDACLTVGYLFCFDLICDNFIARMQLMQSVVFLYIPLLVITSFEPFNKGSIRALCSVVWGSLWVYYQLGKAQYVSGIGPEIFTHLKATANDHLAILDYIK